MKLNKKVKKKKKKWRIGVRDQQTAVQPRLLQGCDNQIEKKKEKKKRKNMK